MDSRGRGFAVISHVQDKQYNAKVSLIYGIFPIDIIEEFRRKLTLVHDARSRFISSVELRISGLEERSTPRHD
jgi:hypothetical protein